MTDSEPRRSGIDFDVRPHSYDPVTQPEFFEGVTSRRILAFLIDLLVITVPMIVLAIFIFIFGIVTLGFGWLLFFLFSPITVIWAVLYYGLTLGSPASATLGMRVMELEMRTWYGSPSYFLLGAVHAIVYWVTVTFLTPFVLLVAFFNMRRRLLHDILLGTVVVNTEARARTLRQAYPGPTAPGPSGPL
jgi:uncharacterized RDD family membrane protein YckC